MYMYMWMHARDITVLCHDIAVMSPVLLLLSLDLRNMYYAAAMPARYKCILLDDLLVNYR